MTDQVLLIGASGLAREVLAAGINGVVGILDDDANLRGERLGGVSVIGAVDEAIARAERLLVCIGSGRARRAVVARLVQGGVADLRFTTFIAPGARIGRTSTVGAGSIVLEGVVITADATLGRHVVVMPNCTLTHDNRLDDYATLAAGVALGGAVQVGEGAYLGMNASVRQQLSIGADATVGMGAAVLSDVPDGESWIGVPARRMKETA